MPQEVLHDQPVLPVEIPLGVKICVENDLTQMSTYVLLEQEDWFEDDMSFMRRFVKPGMRILDIGANHGVYGLTFARLLEDAGHVWAIEPASQPGAMIEAGIRLNGLQERISLLPVALSDHEGEAELNLGGSSELNTLQTTNGSNRTETIQLRTLDGLLDVLGTEPIDFIKLDAEGEEVNVLKGGHRFFQQHDPVILFELKHGSHVNFKLLGAFEILGMSCYYLVPGLQALVPVDDPQKVDGYTLNLYAMKPSKAAELAGRGLLLDSSNESSSPDETSGETDWAEALADRPFSAFFLQGWRESRAVFEAEPDWSEYASSLSELLAFEHPGLPLGTRWKAACRAVARLEARIQQHGVEARTVLLLIRLLNGMGARSRAIGTITRHGLIFKSPRREVMERPFVPPLPSQDALPVKSDPSLWLEARVQEALERRRAFSSFFTRDVNLLSQIVKNPERSVETDRRVALKFLSMDKRVKVRPESWLCLKSHDNRNTWFWKEWAESGTVQRVRPKIYLIAGMHRSGSTWLYNAVRLLLKAWPATGGKVAGGWVVDWQNLPRTEHMVIKTHGYQEAWVRRADLVFYSYRDLRDAMASFRRKFGLADPLALAMQSIQNDKALRGVARYAMRYEQMIEDKVACLRDIASVLGMPVPDDTRLADIAREIDSLSYDSPGPRNAQYHLENLLHKGHITNGQHGSWDKDIPALVIREMERRHEGWLRENRYL